MTIRTVFNPSCFALLLCVSVALCGCAGPRPELVPSSPSSPSGARHAVDRPPVGWRKTPVDPSHFRYSIDASERAQGRASARIDGTPAADERVASISQLFSAVSVLGRTVRVVAQVRQRAIEDWAHMWVSVRAAGGIGLAADRVPLQKVHGDRDWRRLEAQVDVPTNADNFSLGFVLVGEGTFWIDDVKILDEDGAEISTPLRNADFEDDDLDRNRSN